MITNPFSKDFEVLQREHTESNSALVDWKTKSAWFHSFDLDQENANLRQAERLQSSTQAKLHQAQQDALGLASSLARLTPKASIGIDPRHWFSSERAIAKRQVATAQQELNAQRSAISDMKIQLAKATEIGRKVQSEIAAARTFDPLLARSAIAALQAILDRIEPQLASLRQRRDDLEERLREPLASMRKLETERAALVRRMSQAEDFEVSLNRCRDFEKYEKAMIHDRCERELGDRKPANVARQSRSALRSVDSSLGKLRSRVDELVRFAMRDIGHIVIDGSNLCFEDRRFVKLAALEALVPILAQKYEITLIFDASMRRRLGLSNRDFEARFPQAQRVHIVASKRTADETVLAAADDDLHTFVLSNDRFADYPEKRAVKEERVLRHEIINQVVYIHDLHIKAVFEVAQDVEAA
ncbi:MULTISPECIES: hypothetical protein [unclassified Variovorax]|uniref:hypothetical protein n=1 Tax=unclassified Variovorax TaxID=663243 RepID=UPI0008D8085F|nr:MULTISPECIES: hypothetical protein [unclassified Variovorax]SEK17254.1 hypothetical protein SAMN05518853_13921 [Variovorax sp. OK202]SFE76268.1 hypothetical protein SAMN05444746_13721 [Variovorax sp. OK212]